MPLGPDHSSRIPGMGLNAGPLSRPGAFAGPAGLAPHANDAAVTVLRAAPIPAAIPPAAQQADDRFRPTQAIVAGLRESRAMAATAAELVDRLSEARGPEFEALRMRLREVVEIGSARDTSGPLATLYAAARRDPDAPLARVLAGDGTADRHGFAAAAAEAGQELRDLDERFAARDFALTGLSLPKLEAAASSSSMGISLVV